MSGKWGYFLRLAVSAALVWAILSISDGANALSRLAQIDWPWVLLALILLTAQNFAMALRWTWVAHRLGVGFSYAWGLREYYLGNLVNMTLPGGVVGDAARAYRASDSQRGSLTGSVHAVMIDRLIGQITLLMILTLGMIWSVIAGAIIWPDGVEAMLIAIMAVVALATVLAPFVPLPAPILAFGRSFRAAVLSAPVFIRQGALALMIAGLNIAAFYACARATGTTLPHEAVFTLIPLILTAMLVPISVGGWGWREGAAAAVFPLAGFASSAGVAASLAFGLVLLASSLPGIVAVFSPIKTPTPGGTSIVRTR